MISAQYVDNNAIASANIQKPKKSSIWHMVRHGFQAKSVHPEWSHLNEVNLTYLIRLEKHIDRHITIDLLRVKIIFLKWL